MARLHQKYKAITGEVTDPRIRRYLTPKRVLWTSKGDGALVSNEQSLLTEKSNQITLDTGNACVLENKNGLPHAAVLVDFGIEFQGSARIMIWGVKGVGNRTNIRVRFGESAMEAKTPLGVKNTTNDQANRDEIINVGFLCAHETNESGFRFAYLELLDEDAKIELKAIQGVFIYRDLDYIGSFECDDAQLNKIWDTAAYTTHLNMQEYLWDGIKRDRLVWIGDMYTEVMTILAVFGYNEIVPRSLDLVRDETPVGKWMNGISSYSLWWILIHYEWYQAFGNKAYLSEQKTYMTGLMKTLCEYVDENGVEAMPKVRFIDWPNNDNPKAIHAGLQGMLKMALEKGACLLSVLGEHEVMEKCLSRAVLLKKHVPECGGSKQAASLLALSGLAGPEEINNEILKIGGAKGYCTFLGYQTLAAKAMAGDFHGAIADIKEYWGGMLKMGATTFWESFDVDWLANAAPIDELVPEGKDDIHGDFGAYCYVKFRHSLCHGWASGPCPWLSKYVLGIEAAKPGFKEIKIEPHLGPLTFAKGTYPTPYGIIEVSHKKRNDGTVESKVKVPDGIAFTINSNAGN